ncbi:MAG: Gfo/Idh/MocA family oxidoreductase [Candidatus Dormiibacterota bacterium]
MRALILGCGSIGARHARNLVSLNVEIAVTDPNEQRARALAADTGAVVVADRDTASVDVVIIATPTIQHPADVEWSLDHGHHTFIEKPLAATRAGLAGTLAAAGRSDRTTMVACNLRFSDGYRVLREHLAAVGRIISISADFGWYLPAWRPSDDYSASYSARRDLGGGIILDAAIHELDYVIDLAGPVSSVSGLWTASKSLGIDVEDAAEMQLRHENGCISRVHVDYLRRTYTRRCTLVGSDGTLVWDFAEGSVKLSSEPDSDPMSVEGLDGDRNAMYVKEMEHFLEAVASGHGSINDVPRAAATTAVALQVLEQGEGHRSSGQR